MQNCKNVWAPFHLNISNGKSENIPSAVGGCSNRGATTNIFGGGGGSTKFGAGEDISGA